MSRVGKRPIAVPKGVTRRRQKTARSASRAPRASSREPLPPASTSRSRRDKTQRRCAPTTRATPRHARPHPRAHRQHGQGRDRGLRPRARAHGIGYRAEVKGNTLNMALGFSHPIVFPLPEGRHGEGRQEPRRSLSRRRQGAARADRREDPRLPPAEPYGGKGVKYVEEVSKRKAGKAGADQRPGRRITCSSTTAKKRAASKRHKLRIRKRIDGTAERPRLTCSAAQAHLRAGHRRRGRARRWRATSDLGLEGSKRRAKDEAARRRAAKKVGALDRQEVPREGDRQGRLRPQRLHVPRRVRRWPTRPARPG